MFPFSVILKSISKSLIFIHSNLDYYRQSYYWHSVSILLTAEPVFVLGARDENQSLDVVLPFFIFVFYIYLYLVAYLSSYHKKAINALYELA